MAKKTKTEANSIKTLKMVCIQKKKIKNRKKRKTKSQDPISFLTNNVLCSHWLSQETQPGGNDLLVSESLKRCQGEEGHHQAQNFQEGVCFFMYHFKQQQKSKTAKCNFATSIEIYNCC